MVRFLQLLMAGVLLVGLSSFVSAYGYAYVPNTWNSAQVYAGSYFVPNSPYGDGWTFNAYYNNSGYPALGGGTFYPRGYQAGSYGVPVVYPQSYYPTTSYYNNGGYTSYGNYYGGYAPVHTGSDYYNRSFSVSYSNGNYTIGCTFFSC